MADPDYSDFERGERAALLAVRTFIANHGVTEVDMFCAQRLHDIMLDRRHCDSTKGLHTAAELPNGATSQGGFVERSTKNPSNAA